MHEEPGRPEGAGKAGRARSVAAPLVHGIGLLGDPPNSRSRQLRFRVRRDAGSESLMFDYRPGFDDWDGFGIELNVLPLGGAWALYWAQRLIGERPRVRLQARIYGTEHPRALRVADSEIAAGVTSGALFRFDPIEGSRDRRFTVLVEILYAPCFVRVLGFESSGDAVATGGKHYENRRVALLPYLRAPAPAVSAASDEHAPLVSVLIVTYDAAPYIDACLRSIEAQSHPQIETVVVDNASTDGTAEKIRSEYPAVRVLAQGENLDFCRGNNIGLRECKGEYVFVLNADTELQPAAIERMLAMLTISDHVASVGCNIETKGSLLRYADVTIENSLIKGDANVLAADSFILSACGCAFLARASWIERIGELFDEYFVSDQEDHDFGLRCWQAGGLNVHVAQLGVMHLGGAAFGIGNSRRDRRVFRNALAFYLKNFELRGVLIGSVRTLVRCRNRYRWLGVLDFVRDLPELLALRRAQQDSRLVSDGIIGFMASGRLPLGFEDES